MIADEIMIDMHFRAIGILCKAGNFVDILETVRKIIFIDANHSSRGIPDG